MRTITKALKGALSAVIISMLISGTVLAAYSYYANIQVQETSGDSYDYLPVIADIDNDYLADNGYISLTGLDTRVLSGSTELKHLVTDDKTLFVAPSVGALSTGNYRYTLNNTDDLDNFSIIVGYGTGANGYITIPSEIGDDMQLGNDFEMKIAGAYINTDAGGTKNLVYKQGSFRTYISGEDIITSEITPDFPVVEAVTGGNDVVNQLSHTVNLPASVAGDLLLVTFCTDASPTTTIAFPGGWTELFQTLYANYAALGCWYRIADGSEGVSITVDTSDTQMTAHTSYRITNYSGVPVAGASVTGTTDIPDSPSLNPGWGTINTLWFTVCGYNTNLTVSNYPNLYGSGRNDYANDAGGCGVGTARRNLNAVSEDPGTFTLSGAEKWIANTVAVKPLAVVSVTATSITSNEHASIVTKLDSETFSISVDGAVSPDPGYDEVAFTGSVSDNANDWTLMDNSVTQFMPYMDYYKHTVNSDLIAWYQPISMIIGTNLDDREGTDLGETGAAEEDAVITWGSNPVGVTPAVGSLVSSSQPTISPASEEVAIDIMPEGNIPSGGTVDTTALEDNPLHPVVEILVDYTDYTADQIWFIGATLIILIGMALAVVKVPDHLLLGGIVGFVLSGFFIAMGIYQWWMLIIFGFILLMSLIMERKPVL